MVQAYCLGLILGFAFLTPSPASAQAEAPVSSETEAVAVDVLRQLKADASRDSSYTITVTDGDAINLVRGIPLDRGASDYCAKQRDLCLAFTCGNFSEDRVVRECWQYCTQEQFDRCEGKRSER